MPVRTELLAAGRRNDATTVTVYTCPEGKTAIVKSVTLVNVSTTATAEFVIGMDAGTFDKTLWFEQTLAARQRVRFEEWCVLPPGAEITVRGATTAGVNYWISGTELLGVSS